jgi:uncharacterized protein GlcG (DUF336 family)
MPLTLQAIQRMLDAGLTAAVRMGLSVTIVIVDPGGYLLAAIRMDKAPLLSPDIAQGKATAAALFRVSSADLQQRWQPGTPIPTAMSIRMGGRFIPHQGALPIFEGETVVGAVGVSGARSDEDEQIAQAALEAFGSAPTAGNP